MVKFYCVLFIDKICSVPIPYLVLLITNDQYIQIFYLKGNQMKI